MQLFIGGPRSGRITTTKKPHVTASNGQKICGGAQNCHNINKTLCTAHQGRAHRGHPYGRCVIHAMDDSSFFILIKTLLFSFLCVFDLTTVAPYKNDGILALTRISLAEYRTELEWRHFMPIPMHIARHHFNRLDCIRSQNIVCLSTRVIRYYLTLQNDSQISV